VITLKNTESIKSQNVHTVLGISLYKIFWVFLIACIAGAVVETIVYFIKFGYIQSRQGMIYGPLNQVYGFGGVLMVLSLHKIAEKNNWLLFLCGAILGGVFEAVSSFIQENIFNSVSWNYSVLHSSIFDGRTSLVLMLYWGILGVVFMKKIYPHWMGYT
jgi:uncharacterized membrane protein